jgi:hypothetical protein
MDTAKATLRALVNQYRQADDNVQALNANVMESRATRKQLETEIAAILAAPEFSEINKLNISDDGSNIRIQRPGTYSKPWALSKSDLRGVLDAYFASTNAPSADACFEFVCDDRKQKLVATEFALTRTLPKSKE